MSGFQIGPGLGVVMGVPLRRALQEAGVGRRCLPGQLPSVDSGVRGRGYPSVALR